MSMTDCRNVPVSTNNRDSLDRYEDACELLQGYFGNPLAVIDDALAADPQFVMGHCLRAALMIAANEKSVQPLLRESVERAEALAAYANDRERGHIAAARAWLDGAFDRSVKRYGDVLFAYPRDILALQIAHLGDFLLGRSMMLRDRPAQVLLDWDESVPGYGYVLGMHAFGLQEMGEYGRAEATGRRGVALNPRDPWSAHAVAHVMEMQGRTEEGIDWLESNSVHWATDNAFAYHNWWHLALYHLDRGELDRVLTLYDTAIRPAQSIVVLELIDATALLWRLHLRGVDVGGRWGELADAWESICDVAYYAFNDVHAMMAFVATGRERACRSLLDSLERRAQQGGTNRMMTRDVGLPICRALVAFGRQAYVEAMDTLVFVRPIAQRFGGSHAQRDVLILTAIEAALRGGQHAAARALIAGRIDAKPASPANRLLWGRVAPSLAAQNGQQAA